MGLNLQSDKTNLNLFFDIVREIMGKKSIRAFCREIGVSRNNWYKVKNGENNVTLAFLFRVISTVEYKSKRREYFYRLMTAAGMQELADLI